ncbi:MAG: YceI family protein [Syntrophobacteraceae bacterium]|jgi:rhodanese-related sulfurtransferase|nr:YceI family protein [Syntrophobacteraceae bacterium]
METQVEYRVITWRELEEWLEEKRDLIIVDTLTEEQFRRIHLPRAVNACVYQVTFLERMASLVPDHGRTVVVYGSSERSLDALVAAEKLVRAGYRHVFAMAGGLRSWREMGGRVEGEAPETGMESPGLFLENRLYQVDLDESLIEWAGRNPNTRHFGTLRLSEGSISFHDGSFTGSFIVDMRSIVNRSLAGDPLKKVLEAHLASDDFFFVERFPTARFVIESARIVDLPTLSAPNFSVNGVLDLHGLKKDIGFDATLNNLEGGGIVAEAHFDIDRTRWDIIYGSSRFFEHLGMHLVFDLISIQMRIVAR